MSKYIVTNSSYFQPFSYDELAKPVQQMTEAHLASSDAYDQLSMETEALRRYITDNEDDVQAKALYDNYINKLNTLQDNLWNRGYSLGTRRDLSSARAAYASDITRLKSAVQARQERSKEYWDARHKNPDLVAGFDPGMSGLDNYLNDDQYGQNWYSYSGNQFASEVASEVKARGAELVSAYAERDPQLAGYLEYHVKNGFTNAQVNGATLLAQRALTGDLDLTDPSIDPVEGLLASTLLSRLQSTGAVPGQNLSPEEYRRLFNYGVLGLTQGIGSEDVKPINDKVWDYNMDIAKLNHQQALKNAAAKAAASQTGVHRELVNEKVEAPGSDKVRKDVSKYFDDKTYENGPIVVNLPGGGSRQISNAEEARDLFHTRSIDKFYESTGIDLRDHASNFFRTTKSKKTGEYKGVPIMVQEAGFGPFGRGTLVVKKKIGNTWVKAADLTDAANRAKNEYEQTMDRLGAVNPGLNINSLGVTPDEARKLRKEYNIPAGVPDYDLRTAILSKGEVGDYYSIPIAVGPEDQDIKNRFANAINAIYAGSHGKKDWKTADWGFYKVGKDNSTVDKENAATQKNGGLGNVFTVDKTGKIDPNSIYSVTIMPRDVNNGKVKVRLKTSQGTFVTDISTLGDDINTAMNGMRTLGNGINYRLSDAIEMLMLPLNNTIDVLDQSSGAGNGWEQWTAMMLGNAAPMSSAGGLHYATASEVARDPRLQKELLNATSQLLLGTIAAGLNPNTLHPRQHVGYTSAKAGDMFGYDDEE